MRADTNEIREYRHYKSEGDAYRKPKAYKSFISDDVEKVFKRKDSRR